MRARFLKTFKMQPNEARPVLLAFSYFFTLLASYYVLRPIRDEMAMQMGPTLLQQNFFSVFLVMTALVPLFGWITRRFPIGEAISNVYRAFTVLMLVFYVLFEAEGFQSTGVARAFFIFVSVYNLFVVSVFWSFMADIFSTEQSSRFNGLISAGGTLGALAGPAITALSVESVGLKNLILVSAIFLLIAVWCVSVLRKDHSPSADHNLRAVEGNAILGGSVFSGVIDIIRSRYLLAICVFLFLYAILSTFLYGFSTELFPKYFPDPNQRTKFLAEIDIAVNVVSLLGQFFIFGKSIGRWGRKFGLIFLPLLSCVGFLLFGLTESFLMLLGFAILRRAGEYAISKPTRETLFNVLPASQKYRAKNVIDTLVHRTGDVASSSLFGILHSTGMPLPIFSLLAAGFSLVWLGNSIWLSQHAEVLWLEAKAHAGELGVHT